MACSGTALLYFINSERSFRYQHVWIQFLKCPFDAEVWNLNTVLRTDFNNSGENVAVSSFYFGLNIVFCVKKFHTILTFILIINSLNFIFKNVYSAHNFKLAFNQLLRQAARGVKIMLVVFNTNVPINWNHRSDKNVTNIVVQWLTPLVSIWEIPGSNLGPETGYPDWDFRVFLQSLQMNVGIVP
jgi:hypothetical protein